TTKLALLLYLIPFLLCSLKLTQSQSRDKLRLRTMEQEKEMEDILTTTR
uniref:Uncharacterized protein n=1 Tax=Amphimedon queenslandica TaxID=400682 RepID=A0A1X7UHC6_AMPQE